jgi:hypothetical protein
MSWVGRREAYKVEVGVGRQSNDPVFGKEAKFLVWYSYNKYEFFYI